MHLLNILQAKVTEALQALFSEEASLLLPDVVQSTQPQFGHYQCNNALKLGKVLKKNPREIAEKIKNFLQNSTEGILKNVEIAGSGFINLTIDPLFLEEGIEELLRDEHLGIPYPPRQRIIVEFSSPNIAKELHVGHLRSTIIGDSLARIFEFLGHDVLRLSHIGDWGTQFGMLIAYMSEYQPEILSGKKQTDLPHLMQWYRAAKKLFDEEEEFKKRAQREVVELQGGNLFSLKVWKIICDISRRAVQEIYDLLDVQVVERGESFYNPLLPQIVEDLEQKGLITFSDGAKCLFLEGFINREGEALPLIVQKTDGGYNYATTDMAAVYHRTQIEKAEQILLLTDAGQILHFQMIIKAAEKAGYLTEKTVMRHIPFGVVLGPDGKKFKTRSGETEKLIDLLQGAIDHAKNIMRERLPELSEEELQKISTILGIDALKYADLSGNRIKDYVFSYERMLKFEGNTAAFLLYAYVRINGIKRKVGKDIATLHAKVELEHPTEIALALHLLQFSEAIECVAKELLPNRLADYLYALAEKFHAFFRDCRVEGSLQEESRLLLSEATARVLKTGLSLLGLKTLDKM